MAYYAGQLRHPILIQKPVDVVDKYGRTAKTWSTVTQLFAKVGDVGGREYYEAASYQMEHIVTFTTRNVPCVTTAMRIIFDGNTYEIDQINHLGYRGDFMSIKAKIVEAEAYGAD